MIGPVELPALGGAEADVWPVLFALDEKFSGAWALVGAQMVALHAMAHGAPRPRYTQDADVLVNVRTLGTRRVAEFLESEGFELDGISTGGVGHLFARGKIKIDVLALDRVGERADTTTIPPARTVRVPGGAQVMKHLDHAEVVVHGQRGSVPVPTWEGALLLKSRAALSFPEDRAKHLQDVALLLGLPIDVLAARKSLTSGELRYVRKALGRIDDSTWLAVAGVIDERVGRAAVGLLS